MKKNNFFFSVVLFLIFFNVAMAAVKPERVDKLALPERTFLPISDVSLSEEDWHWLRVKKVIKLGISNPDTPPFDLFIYDREYSGATADYSDLVSQLLGIKFEVYRYANRDVALQALADGQVDLLGTSNRFDIFEKPFILSKPYIQDRPVLVTDIGDTRHFPASLDGVSIAVAVDYISISELKSKYPKANIKVYPSVNSAMGAVAFGRMDMLIGDLTTVHYLINNNYSKYLKIYKSSDIDSDGYSFAFDKNNVKLKKIIDKALDSVTLEQKVNIIKRWGGSSSVLIDTQRWSLTVAEQQWLVEHPVVSVEVSDYQAPISYFDDKGKFRGLIADVLNNIELHTGIQFDIKRNPVFSTMTSSLQNNSSDILAGLSRTPDRSKSFLFTRPIFRDQYAVIVKKGVPPVYSLKDLEHKNIALTASFSMVAFLREKHPKINIIETKSHIDALGLVDAGKADATISSLSIAEYYLPNLFNDRLIISSSLDLDEEGPIPQPAFAVRRGDVELYSILDKALLSISPDEYALLISRWQPNAAASPQRWSDYQLLIYQVLAGLVLCFVLVFLWNSRLRRHSKQLETAQRALADQLRFMENLTNGAPFSIYVRDKNGVLLLCNDFMLKELNINREDVVGKISSIGLVDTQTIEGLEEDYEEVLKDGISIRNVRSLYRGGEKFSVYLWMQAYRDLEGKIKGVVCSYADITERQQLLEDFKLAKEIADSASKAKTTFLATMSHEIRTPINAVVGMLELVLKKAEREVFDMPAIEVAYGSARNLLELIGDILDVVRIEADSLSLAPERCNLREQVESVVRVFDGLARQKSLRLLLDLDATVNRDVLMDPLRFKQILSNVLSNAIKFTQEGQVSIKIAGVLTDQEHLQVRLLVKDSGIGISLEDQQRLFQPFAQAENNNQSARAGTGLGLVISRNLCELMGGGLQLNSAVGKGTEIQITFSVSTLDPLPALPVLESAPAQRLGALNILVVDDHSANRLLICEQLNYLGHQVRSAVDGAVGLMYWREEFFDVVITDCNMPVMSGYELAKCIRSEEVELNRDPCVLFGFTANAQPEERTRCISIGMDDCLFKPIGIDDLAQHLLITPRDSSKAMKKIAPYQLSKLEKLVGKQPQAVQRLLDELINSNREDLDSLLSYFDNMDLSGLSELAHKVKGGALVIQATDIVLSCEAIEDACKRSNDVEVLSAAVSALEEAILALEQALLPLLNTTNNLHL